MVMENLELSAQIAAINRSQAVVEFKADGTVLMHDASGARVQIGMEWLDRAKVRQTEQEMQDVLAAVIDGDMQARIELGGKDGFFATLSEGINELIASFADVVGNVKSAAAEVARGVQEISQGNEDLSQRTEAQSSSLE